nr:hypothetical protein KUHPSE09_09140 [Staphylococcus epidermidis]
MPELKKPTDKEDKNHSAFKNHSADEITTNNDEHSKDYDKKRKCIEAFIIKYCNNWNFSRSHWTIYL